jgi:hypothetical protein
MSRETGTGSIDGKQPPYITTLSRAFTFYDTLTIQFDTTQYRFVHTNEISNGERGMAMHWIGSVPIF